VFVDLTGPEPGGPDGMKVDTAGNVYCGGGGGIYIMDPKGKKLGRIDHGRPERPISAPEIALEIALRFKEDARRRAMNFVGIPGAQHGAENVPAAADHSQDRDDPMRC
jgi:hypothetical protein